MSPSWIPLIQAGLHAGESGALVLAQENGAEVVLMDDQDGIRHTNSHGLTVLRTPGIYRLAKKNGLNRSHSAEIGRSSKRWVLAPRRSLSYDLEKRRRIIQIADQGHSQCDGYR